MPTLVCTLETVAPTFSALSPHVQHELTRWISQKAITSEAMDAAQRQVEAQLPYSPLTASIAVLGLHDVERGASIVYYVDTKSAAPDANAAVCKVRTEASLLEDFWAGAPQYDTFVSFNGRRFLIPFLLQRSALHGILPSVPLPLERNLLRQGPVQHIDLLDQLTCMGMTRRHTLYHYCHAYGLPLPTTIEAAAAVMTTGPRHSAAAASLMTLTATVALYAFWNDRFRESQTIVYS